MEPPFVLCIIEVVWCPKKWIMDIFYFFGQMKLEFELTTAYWGMVCLTDTVDLKQREL